MTRGVLLESLRGSGPGGRIVRSDVEAAPKTAAPAPQVTQSLRMTADIPIGPLLDLRAVLGERISLTSLLLKAAAHAWHDATGAERMTLSRDGEPMVDDLDRIGIAALSRALTPGKSGWIIASPDKSATLSILNMGKTGAADAAPVAALPGTAQLVIGAATERVLPIAGKARVTLALRCALVTDAAALDNASAAALLASFTRLIEQPLAIIA